MDDATAEQITLREILTLHQLRTATEYPVPCSSQFSNEEVAHSWGRLSIHELIQQPKGKASVEGTNPTKITKSGRQRLEQLEAKYPDE
jgi:hypothetical protein